MKLAAMPCMATQDGWVMVEHSDKTWSTGEGTTSVFLPWTSLKEQNEQKEPHEHHEKAKRYELKDELPRLVGTQ